MPVIQQYEDKVGAQGQLNVHANANDFGAQIGEGMQRLGAGMADVADATAKYVITKDTTEQHVNLASARDEWTLAMEARKNEAKPGDDTFAQTLHKDMADYFTQGSEAAKTGAGRRLWKTMGATMSSEFHTRAVGIQSQLDAQEAIVQNDKLHQKLGNTAYTDPSQAEAIMAQGIEAIRDPASIYHRVPESIRNDYEQKLVRSISLSAMKGIVRDNPFAVMGALDPEQLKLFKPFEKLLELSKVPGGRIDISPTTMAKAAEILPAASAKLVNPNITLAQVDVEGDKADPKAQIDTMHALLNKYGGEYSMALAAYQMGTEAFEKHQQAYGANWQSNLPPAVAEYVDTVTKKAGWAESAAPAVTAEGQATQVPPAAAPPAQGSLEFKGFPLTKNLTFQELDHLAGESVRLGTLSLSMKERAREQEEREKKEEQKKVMTTFDQAIFHPEQYGKFDSNKLWSPETKLEPEQKEHLQLLNDRVNQEKKLGRENATHPEAVRELDRRMHLPVGDPKRISSFEDVNAAYWKGDISFNERNNLQTAFAVNTDGDSAGFGPRWNKLQKSTEVMLSSSIQGSIGNKINGSAIQAYNEWVADGNQKIASYRKEGKDIEPLLDPRSADYIGNPQKIFSFLPSAKETLSTGAKAEIEKAKQDKTPDGELKVGAKYEVQKGVWKEYLGGKRNLSTSWK